jgi:hypothetical protein
MAVNGSALQPPKAQPPPCAKSKRQLCATVSMRPNRATHHGIKICMLSRGGSLQQTRRFKQQQNAMGRAPVTRTAYRTALLPQYLSCDSADRV